MSASGRKERPLKQRFDNAVSMIRSLPKEGQVLIKVFAECTNPLPSSAGPFQPSNTVKLRVSDAN